MGIKCFRDIWNGDKDENKANAIMVFSLLYFMYDPRSSYRTELDEEERYNIIKLDIGLPDEFEMSALYEKAKDTYIRLSESTSSKTIDNNRKLLKKIEDYINSVTINDKNFKALISIVPDMNDIAKTISQAETAIYNDMSLKEVEKDANKTLGDKGLARLFS
jgi:hypothetical protein